MVIITNTTAQQPQNPAYTEGFAYQQCAAQQPYPALSTLHATAQQLHPTRPTRPCTHVRQQHKPSTSLPLGTCLQHVLASHPPAPERLMAQPCNMHIETSPTIKSAQAPTQLPTWLFNYSHPAGDFHPPPTHLGMLVTAWTGPTHIRFTARPNSNSQSSSQR